MSLLQGVDADFRYRVPSVFALYLLATLIAYKSAAEDDTTTLWLGSGAAVLVAILLSLFGTVVRAWATGYLPAHIIADQELRAPKLIRSGPFSVTRNPLYLGTYCILVSFACLLNIWALVFMVLAAALRVERIMRFEEVGLSNAFGAQYSAYVNEVPRLFPSSLSAVAKVLSSVLARGYLLMWFCPNRL
eukprot:TRINITY_DN6409_c0_g3_i2.p1 TRINITY_DN6409_c0_g3~~TRINITY_DN6409_c0_g3_i2.p1  ORF type:complete len:189 (-),score=39.11 TRINITY_DN6409_c0_g3_i2:261-827(-)